MPKHYRKAVSKKLRAPRKATRGRRGGLGGRFVTFKERVPKL